MTYTLHRTQVVAQDLASVFAFFKDPHNLEAITPPWLRFRILMASDATVRAGTRIRYALRILGVPVQWESAITHYEENRAFADEQVVGPYRSWYHRHEFREVPGGVEIVDHVTYALPFGPLGRLVHALVVRHQLRAIFDYRAKRIRERFARPT
ncbi:MAG: SRPBCC family protein [Gemmatimonadetes bacterium]|nr:SRPBCC family protein [Gemmatimonadota bacterium]